MDGISLARAISMHAAVKRTPSQQRLIAHREACAECSTDGAYCVVGVTLQEHWRQAERKNRTARERHAALTDMGMVRVRGALGGVYYE